MIKRGVYTTLFTTILFLLFNSQLNAQSTTNSLEGYAIDTSSVRILIAESKKLNSTDSAKAFHLGKLAVQIAEQLEGHANIIRTKYNLAKLYRGHNIHNQAIYYYQEVIDLCMANGMQDHVPNMKRELGRVYYEGGDFTTAMEIYMEALAQYDELGVKDSSYAWLLRYIGSVFKRQHNNERALEYYLRAVELFKNLEEHDGIASSYNTIANAYLGMEQFELSLKYYLMAKEVCEDHQLKHRRLVIIGNLGNIYTELEQFDDAIMYIDQEYAELADTINRKPDYAFIGSNRSNLARVFYLQKNYQKALEYYEQAEHFIKKSEKKQIQNLEGIFKGRYLVFEAQGEYKLALDNFKQYSTYRDSLSGSYVVSKVKEIESNYETSKDHKIINHLNSDNKTLTEQNEEEVAFSRRVTNGIIALCFVILGILIFSFIIYRQKKQLEKASANLFEKNLEVLESEQKLREITTTNKVPPVIKQIKLPTIEDKYSGSALSEEQKEELLIQIINTMEEDQIFKEKDLTVFTVAKVLDTNKSYISQVINEKLSVNFSNFVNEYRIKEARRMLSEKEHRHLTIEAISGITGFNSISTFNSAFKKFTGITPSFFLKSVIAKEKEDSSV